MVLKATRTMRYYGHLFNQSWNMQKTHQSEVRRNIRSLGTIKACRPENLQLRISFRSMSEEQRVELAKQAEVELRTGLEIMGRDKKAIRELISLVDPPATA